MIRRFFQATVAIVAATSCIAFAATPKPAPAPSLNPKPAGAEAAFVASASKDLNARFATTAEAEKAGFFRYTNEDNTGAISYVNIMQWGSDVTHPSQLWYSASGKLIGVDYSVLLDKSPSAPQWPAVNPGRWVKFGHSHIHYILVDAKGKETYGATSTKKYLAAGGSETNPTAAPLVKMGIAKNAAQVKKVFVFPALWDLEFWVVPNPNGAFADHNPLVKPSASAEKDSM